MTFQILDILNNMESRLYGYCTLLGYRYMNICVKPEPVSLLSTSVIIDDNPYELEKVSKVVRPDDDSLQIIPVEQSLIPDITQAILLEHPEFKLDIVDDPSAKRESDDAFVPKMIVLTVPPVDEDGKKSMLDLVNALYQDCDKRMKADFGVAVGKAGVAAITLPEETQKETKKAFEDSYNNFVEQVKKYRENKTKEIEDAYARWCVENGNNEKKEREEKEAENRDAAFKMALDDTTLEN